MEREKPNNQNKLSQKTKEGYLIVPNYFLREWVKVLGIGPALLYLQLLSYCHKEKDIAWPSITTLSRKLDISKNSLLSYRKILLKHGLIKKIIKRRAAQGNYQSNFYKITPIEGSANIELRQVQILGEGGANIAPGVVQNLHPNNTNLNTTNLTTTTTKREKDAVAVNFKKLKEEGDVSRYNAQAEEKMQAIRERMVKLDFKEVFIEKILKEYSTKKIDEKLDLLLERKNIQNPPAWLSAALKNDYRGEEPSLSFPRRRESSECHDESRIDSRFHGNDKSGGGNGKNGSGNPINTLEWTSTEEAVKAIKLIQDNISACISPVPTGRRTRFRKL